MKTTIIKNVLTGQEVAAFYNGESLQFNLVTFILLENNLASQIHNEHERSKIKTELITSKNNSIFAYSQNFDLIAKN